MTCAPWAPNPAVRRRFWFNIGLAGFGSWLAIAAYLIVWVK